MDREAKSEADARGDRSRNAAALAHGDGYAGLESAATEPYMLAAISAARAAGWPPDEDTRECIAVAARMGADLYADLVAGGEDPQAAAERSIAATRDTIGHSETSAGAAANPRGDG